MTYRSGSVWSGQHDDDEEIDEAPDAPGTNFGGW